MITDNDNKIKDESLNRPLDENILKEFGWVKHEISTYGIRCYYTNNQYEDIMISECSREYTMSKLYDYDYCYRVTLDMVGWSEGITLTMYTIEHYIQFQKIVEKIRNTKEEIRSIANELRGDIEHTCEDCNMTVTPKTNSVFSKLFDHYDATAHAESNFSDGGTSWKIH